MHVEISIDFEQEPRSARNRGHDKRGEIWMSLMTCGSIHEGHEWFSSNDSRGRQDIFLCVWLFYYVSNFWRCQDIDQVLPHEIIFFLFQCRYSAAVKCLAKLHPFGVNCRLQLAGLGKKREEIVKPTCLSLLLICRKRLRYHTENHRQIIHSILRPSRP